MLLIELMEATIDTAYLRAVNIDGEVLAEYDGKNSIPECLNDFTVAALRVDRFAEGEEPTAMVAVLDTDITRRELDAYEVAEEWLEAHGE